jgi:hypothetical protein
MPISQWKSRRAEMRIMKQNLLIILVLAGAFCCGYLVGKPEFPVYANTTPALRIFVNDQEIQPDASGAIHLYFHADKSDPDHHFEVTAVGSNASIKLDTSKEMKAKAKQPHVRP